MSLASEQRSDACGLVGSVLARKFEHGASSRREEAMCI
jgi:hypothetical protein